MSIETIKVPDLGGADSVEVIEVCVAVGDVISLEDSLVVLESDKASMEVPSPAAGRVSAIAVKEGDSISEGAVLMEIETDAADSESTKASESTTDAQESVSTAAPVQEATRAEPQPEPAAPANDDQGGAVTQSTVTVPDLGGPEQVTVIEVCVSEGDEVEEGDSLVVLESDKASMEVPSPAAGKVLAVAVKEGQQASPGAEILQLQIAGAQASTAAVPEAAAAKTKTPQAAPAASPEVPVTNTPNQSTDSREIPTPSFAKTEPDSRGSGEGRDAPGNRPIYAGPAVRKLAREMGITLEAVTGTGPRQRITKDDLKAFVKTALTSKPTVSSGSGVPQVPAVDFSRFGEVRIEPMSKIHRVTMESMHRSWLNVPHVTQFDEVDITDLEEFRGSLKAEAEQRGVKVTPVAFLLKACANALKQHPKFNCSLHSDGESIVYKEYVHIGLAVDTPQGLMVPVIRDVDKKSVWQLAAESAELAQKAKDRKLAPTDMQGGCFTISSLGSIGGQGFTPIVNTPEVAILAVSRLGIKPVWNGSEFVPRKMLPLSLSYDHRAVNGADCGRFFTYLNELLSDVRRLAL